MLDAYIRLMKQPWHLRSELVRREAPEGLEVRIEAPDGDLPSLYFTPRSTHWVTDRSARGGGVHEPGLVKGLFALRTLLGDPPRGVFYDVGAFHGYCGLMAAAILEPVEVHAFEMNPRSADLSEANFALNPHLGAGLHLVRAGVTTQGRASVRCMYKGFALRVEPNAEDTAKYRADGYEEAQLDLLALDQLRDQGAAAPSVIKIDVEGSQMSILKGAQRLLAETGPALMIELDYPNFDNSDGHTMAELCAFLRERCGYEMIVYDHRHQGFDVIYDSRRGDEEGLGRIERNLLLVGFPAHRE